mgnify:CR=1 FL=1
MPEINLFQVLFNGVVTGSLYVLVALGLTMTYGLTRFPNFAHAEFIVFGAYIAYSLLEFAGLNFPLTLLVSSLAAGVLGVSSFLGVFRPLTRRGATLIHLMVASIALGLLLRYSIQQVWGRLELHYTKIVFSGFNIGPIRTTELWLIMLATAIALTLTMHLILTRTKVGKAMRAASANPALAQASGIDVERMAIIVWFLGAALAGLGGIFRAADTRLTPTLGWEILLPTFAVVILGGIGSFYGAVLGAYLLGVAENLGVVLLNELSISTTYRPAISFLILIIMILIKPTGLMGLKDSVRK